MAHEIEKKSYKDTLHLPTTSLPMRPDRAQTAKTDMRWYAEGIVDRYFASQSKTPFILHDGPPYANGHIHMGHALNKVLKDIIVRVAKMDGHDVRFQPGWDCHGLPIEHKIVAEQGSALRETDPVAFKKACRAYVEKWKASQLNEFKQLGVWAEWEHRYMTMDPSYEADILQAFAQFVEDGFIERKGKTVPWCFSCQTVLANAEIEYAERKDPSCYVLFPVASTQVLAKDKELFFLVWTTTPWTLPLNRAVMVHPTASYALIALDDQRVAIVGADLVASLEGVCGRSLPVLKTIPSTELIGLQLQHLFDAARTVPVIPEYEVSVSDGTACLHSAPGCGPEDYLMGIKHGLEIYSPLTAAGTYDDGIVPAELCGMPITDGQWWVLKQLSERGLLFHKASIKHSYPHCWRCQNGLMFRATDQWFCNLAKNNLITEAQASLNDIDFVPSWGKNRLDSFLAHRTEWCISRQRSWGMPIPALFNALTEEVYISASFVRAIAQEVATHGIEYWDAVTIPQLREKGLIPEAWAELSDAEIRKEKDILDVWFDSGVSHFAAIKQRGFSLPVDVYIEGSDQCRGWFQSSLLTSMVLHKKSPCKTLITHGFVVDEKGYKMSKSRGNVVDPLEVIQKYSPDVLRLWVASVDFERDVSISPKMLEQVAENFRKLRNTCRFLLANLFDFNPAVHMVAIEDLRLIDAQALAYAQTIQQQVLAHYRAYEFAQVVQVLTRYCTIELSAQYLDISKDRLYVEAANSIARRSAQTVQYYMLEMLQRLLAPIFVYTAEDIFEAIPYSKEADSVHLLPFITMPEMSVGSDVLWKKLFAVRDEILRHIEREREKAVIKHSLEASLRVYIAAGSDVAQIFEELSLLLNTQSMASFIKEWLIVSQVTMAKCSDELSATAINGLFVGVSHAKGVKCPRCWHWSESAQGDDLCERCAVVVG